MPMPTPRISIVGLGPFGQAIARLSLDAGISVTLWARRVELELPEALRKCPRPAELVDATRDADIVFFAVPVTALRALARRFGDVARPDQIVLHAIRGVEPGFLMPTDIIRQETCVRYLGVLGGPLHAPDLSSRRSMAVVLASRFDLVFARARLLAQAEPVSLHRSRDVIGVQVAGALANVAALAVGMCDALGLGDTARGILLTRGLAEASLLGKKLGADAQTFAGLAGVGELIPRKVTTTERHHVVGDRLVRGQSLATILADVGGEVEGAITARAAVDKARSLGISLPLAAAVAQICAQAPGVDAAAVLDAVLAQPLEM